jgi:GNAT superfamily N-acetyltransferase
MPAVALVGMSCETVSKSVACLADGRALLASEVHAGPRAPDPHHGKLAAPAAHRPAARRPVIGALRAGDAWPVVAVHEGLSPASRRLRYCAPTPRLSPRMLRALTDLTPGQHEAYAAWRGARPIGIVRWIRTSELPDTAELALEVVDDEHRRGIGRALTEYAAVQAWRAGVRTMVVSVDPDNVPVRSWLTMLRARALLSDADRFAVPMHALFGGSPAHL